MLEKGASYFWWNKLRIILRNYILDLIRIVDAKN